MAYSLTVGTNYISNPDNNNNNNNYYYNTSVPGYVSLPTENSSEILNSIPTILMIEIFKEIPFIALKKNVSLVSHKWNQLCQNTVLELRRWHTLVERVMPKPPYSIFVREPNALDLKIHYIQIQGLEKTENYIQEQKIENSYGIETRSFKGNVANISKDLSAFEDKKLSTLSHLLVVEKYIKVASLSSRNKLIKVGIEMHIKHPALPKHVIKLINETKEYVNAVVEKRRIAEEAKKPQKKRPVKEINTPNKERKI